MEFGIQFYPTPTEVIEKMLKPFIKSIHTGGINGYMKERYDLDGKSILEPNGGKGDIINHIIENNPYGYNKPKIYTYEIDPNLADILKSNDNCVFLGYDFFEANNDIYYDYIIMNPPFKNGDDHLLKAWEILHEGEIVCLLNSETIKNPYSEKRKLICKLIDDYGSVEHIGAVFSDSENKTDVEVSIVRLSKKEKENIFNWDFEIKSESKKDNIAEDIVKSISSNEIIEYDPISAIVEQYTNMKDAHIKYMESSARLNYFSSGLVDSYFNVIEAAYKDGYSGRESHNSFMDKIKRSAWMYVLSKSGLEKYMTSNLRQNFNKFISEQSQMAFNKENIYNVIKTIISNANNILEKAIEDAFDLMTKYYNENRCHVEGWKTNDSWKVNKKVILPNIVEYGEYTSSYDLKEYGSKFSLNYNARQNLFDIETALCFISGFDFNMIRSIEMSLKSLFDELGYIKTGDKFKSKTESTFFDIKFFKKGTIHIIFKDDKLWEDFNIRATKMKNWLPHREYDEWKARRNGEKRTPKSKRIEQTSLF